MPCAFALAAVSTALVACGAPLARARSRPRGARGAFVAVSLGAALRAARAQPPPPLAPLSSFAASCSPGSFEYAAASAGENYATSSNLQAVLPAVYASAPVSLSESMNVINNGYTYFGPVTIDLPSGNNSICDGDQYIGSTFLGCISTFSICTTFSEAPPGVFSSIDGGVCSVGGVRLGVYSSTVAVTCGASAAVTSVVQTSSCAWAVAVISPAVCPPPDPTPVSITLCAGTTVANSALVVAPGSVVSIGCTSVTTPPSCALDGGGQALFVVAGASVTVAGVALNNWTPAPPPLPPPPSPPPPPPPLPLPPLSSFASSCAPGSFEYGTSPTGENYATSSTPQAVLPPVYVDAPVSFSGICPAGYMNVSLPSGPGGPLAGSVVVCPGGQGSCSYQGFSIGRTFTEASPGVFTATDGDAFCNPTGAGNRPYSSTLTVSCAASAEVTYAVQTGCAWAVIVTSPAACPPPNPTPVSITLCAGTTVANAALVVAPGAVISIGCTRVTTPPVCVLDGGGVSQILFVGTSASVTLSGLALNDGAGGHNLIINGGATTGGAVFVSKGATLVANGDAFKNDTAKFGGALFESSAAVNVADAAFSSDVAVYGDGGAIYAGRGNVDAIGALFSNNSAYFGGALYESNSVVNATNAVFVGGAATYVRCEHAACAPTPF